MRKNEVVLMLMKEILMLDIIRIIHKHMRSCGFEYF